MMAKIATLAAGLALLMSQPAMAAPMAPTAAMAGDGGSAPPPVGPNGHHNRFRDPAKDAVWLAALTAAILGILAATSDGGGKKRRPTSP